MSQPKMKSYVSKLRPTKGFGMLVDLWQTRYMVLQDGQLAYFKDEKSYMLGQDPRGQIDLKIATVFNQNDGKKALEVTVRTPGRDYRFRFQTADLLGRWCDALAVHEKVQTVNARAKQEITPKFHAVRSNIPLPKATGNDASNSMLSVGSTEAADSTPSTPTTPSTVRHDSPQSVGRSGSAPTTISEEPKATPRKLDDDGFNDPDIVRPEGYDDPDIIRPASAPGSRMKNTIVPKMSGSFRLFGSGKFGSSSKSMGSSKSLVAGDEVVGYEKKETTLCGIGIVFRPQQDGSLKVRKLLEGSSALDRGEIELGDFLVGVDDLDITGETTPEEVSKRVLGPAGAEVKLKLKRHLEDGTDKEILATVVRTMPANAAPTIVSNPWKSSVSQHQYLNLVDAFHVDANCQRRPAQEVIANKWSAADDYIVPV